MRDSLKISFITGPYFLDEKGALGPFTVTVTDQHYECLLRNYVIPGLKQCRCMDRIIFMQDGAPPHIANPEKKLLKRPFGISRIINRHFLQSGLPDHLILIRVTFGCGAN